MYELRAKHTNAFELIKRGWRSVPGNHCNKRGRFNIDKNGKLQKIYARRPFTQPYNIQKIMFSHRNRDFLSINIRFPISVGNLTDAGLTGL